jgi:hypothetical protein
MSTVPSLRRVDEWPCRGTVIEPVAVKFGDAVGPAHGDVDESDGNGAGEASDDGDGIAEGLTVDNGDGVADGDRVVALPTQPATEIATIRPAIANPTPA